jgi:quinoprotein glucose dehydrogenase
LGDDLRLIAQGVTGTGSAATTKGGMIVTSTGLVFATAADRKVHIYDSATGDEVTSLPLGGPTSGQPAMFEEAGRQYLLVTAASKLGPTPIDLVPAPHTGPTGIVAYALPSSPASTR